MRPKPDHLVLGFAFAVAVALHAALVPWAASAVGGETREPLPDWELRLHIPGTAAAGDSIQALIEFENYETVFQPVVFPIDRNDEVWLSRDRQLDRDDQRIEKKRLPCMTNNQHDGVVTALDLALSISVELPADADGPYWLIYQADVDQEVPDRDRSNNTRSAPIFIDGPQSPELSIDRFDAPDQATPGGSVLVDLNIRNLGDGWAANPDVFSDDRNPPHWADRVYLSVDGNLDEGDLLLRSFDRATPLKPDGTYTRERVELAIPRGLSGSYFLIAVADADQVLDQPSFTAGLVTHAIELVDSAAPDLVVAGIDRPGRLVINRPTPVAFSVANLGSVATAGADWVDGVYLSKQPVIDERSVWLGEVPADQPLQPRARYETSTPITLPESVEPGAWYLVVKTDHAGALDENGLDDNNALAVPVTVITEAQADAEVQLGDPDRPQRLVVQWIESDRLEQHAARQSRTVQPALQDQADPDPNAELIDNPEPLALASTANRAAGDPANPQRPTGPTDQQAARPQPTLPDPTQTDIAPRPQAPGSPTPQRIDGLPGDTGDLPKQREGIDRPSPTDPRLIDPTPAELDEPTLAPGDRRVDSPADPTAPDTDRTTDSRTPADRQSDTDATNPDENDSNQPSERMDETQSDNPTDNPDADDPSEQDGAGDSEQQQSDTTATEKPADEPATRPEGEDGQPASPSEQEQPTRAPRDESEAPPTNNVELEVELQEGRVLVGEGVKVTPKRPTPPGTGARILSVPRNARVRVTFDNKGKVVEAEVIRSTTYADWDAAIEASLYRWSAEGEAIDNARPYVVIEWNYLLNALFEDD